MARAAAARAVARAAAAALGAAAKAVAAALAAATAVATAATAPLAAGAGRVCLAAVPARARAADRSEGRSPRSRSTPCTGSACSAQCACRSGTTACIRSRRRPTDRAAGSRRARRRAARRARGCPWSSIYSLHSYGCGTGCASATLGTMRRTRRRRLWWGGGGGRRSVSPPTVRRMVLPSRTSVPRPSTFTN